MWHRMTVQPQFKLLKGIPRLRPSAVVCQYGGKCKCPESRVRSSGSTTQRASVLLDAMMGRTCSSNKTEALCVVEPLDLTLDSTTQRASVLLDAMMGRTCSSITVRYQAKATRACKKATTWSSRSSRGKKAHRQKT